MTAPLILFVGATTLWGCTKDNDAEDYEADAILAVKDIVAADIGNFRTAAQGIHDGAPTPDADGWSATADGAAVDAMKGQWAAARIAYERVEGAIAVLFPDLDASTDERYDGFIADAPDDNLFDGEGVTGVHGIERILWADSHTEAVIAFESGLSGYTPAAFPATEAEATDFRDGLCQRLVDDVGEMNSSFEPLALDAAAAYGGVVGSMAEQVEKITLAQTGEEESRYARHTLQDMRANLDGGLEIYGAFSPWIVAQDGGQELDDQVRAGFQRVQDAYDAIPGTSLPEVPATWSSTDPSAEDLATDYGQLWSLLQEESDPEVEGSLVSAMLAAADLIGIQVVL